MNIWIIEEGEPIPITEKSGRLMRCGILSQTLADRENNVTWFASDYSHQQKARIGGGLKSIPVKDNYNIVLLHTKTIYKNHISLKRLKYYRELAKTLKEEMQSRPVPDIIFCGFPSIDSSYEAVKYGQEHNVPVIIDVRDFWPDLFLNVLPSKLRGFGRAVLRRMFKKAEFILKNADVVTTVCPYGVKWCNDKGRAESAKTEVLYNGYPKRPRLSGAEEQKVADFWNKKDIKKGNNIICFFGVIGKMLDFKPVIDAIEILRSKNVPVQFVICGNGDMKENYENLFRDYPEVSFPGYITQDKIAGLMDISLAGLVPYDKVKFGVGIVNKSIEYMSGGLPVLSLIDSDLGKILRENEAGFVFDNGNDLSCYIELLANDEEKRQRIGTNAKKLYEKQFCAEKIYNEFAEYLEDYAKQQLSDF